MVLPLRHKETKAFARKTKKISHEGNKANKSCHKYTKTQGKKLGALVYLWQHIKKLAPLFSGK